MTTQELVTRIRRRLDQVPLSQESVDTDSEVLGSVSTNFSDQDLIERINKAQRAIVSNVKAQHIPQAITKKTSVTAVEQDAVRVLPRRVFVSTDGGSTFNRAFRRSVDTQRRLESRISSPGREATSDYPVYVYENGRFEVYPTGSTVEAYVVESPPAVNSVSDPLTLDARFERAIVDYVAASCYQTMRQTGLSDFFKSIFESDIQPYSLEIRYGSLDDQEVDVE